MVPKYHFIMFVKVQNKTEGVSSIGGGKKDELNQCDVTVTWPDGPIGRLEYISDQWEAVISNF